MVPILKFATLNFPSRKKVKNLKYTKNLIFKRRRIFLVVMAHPKFTEVIQTCMN